MKRNENNFLRIGISATAITLLLGLSACNTKPSVSDSIPTTAPAVTAGSTPEPTPTPLPTATVTPFIIPGTTPTPAVTPVITQAPTTSVDSDSTPTQTVLPTVTPTQAVLPVTSAPVLTPTQAVTPVPTQAPQPTNTPVATVTPTEAPKEDTPDPAVLNAPKFSAEGGFYEELFTLTLSAPSGHTVFYTTDGSDPRTSSTALAFTKPIMIYDNTSVPNTLSAIRDISLSGYYPPAENVEKGIVIRAVSKASDGTYSSVVTNSYFVGKTAPYYTDMRVISMVTDKDYLFHPDTGAYMIGSGYYTWKNSSEAVNYDPGDALNPTNYNKDGKDSEFPVSIQVFESGKSAYSGDVGARISGNWSRASAQKSIRLYARKEYGTSKMKYAFFDDLLSTEGKLIKKFDKVTLRNGGNDSQYLHFRDAFFQDLASNLAVDTMASEPYILFINGEFWGFYLLREKPEDYYIERHYGIDEKSVAVLKNGGLDSGKEQDLEDFRTFCEWAMSADMTVDANYKAFCDGMDLQSFFDYMTVETYINNHDWANGYYNNWQVWRSNVIDPNFSKADGKWRFIFYDLDMAAGLYGSHETSAQYDLLNKMNVSGTNFNFPAILRNICKNKTCNKAFYDNYLRIIEDCFAPKVVDKKLDAYVKAYSQATKDTYFRFGMDWAAYNYDSEVDRIRNFFRYRPDYAKQYLAAFCGIETEKEEEVLSENLVVPVERWYYYGQATFSADYSTNTFSGNVPATTPNNWDIQSSAPELVLENGYMYKLTFDASWSNPSPLGICINRFDGIGYPTFWGVDAPLTPELAHYEYYFFMESGTYPDWRLCFNYGHGTGDFLIKNVSLTKVIN